jgi:enoyl-CoA hydratase/carnithine racemase
LSSSRQSQTGGAEAAGGGGGRLLIDEPAPGVARLKISNPQRRGALDHPILDAFATVLPTLRARCLILTGEGETFSAGYDLGSLEEEVLPEEADRLVAHPFTAALDAIEAYPYPTVAALNGHAIGGGLELALACDLRMAADTVSVGMPPAKLGLVYSHTGIRKFIDAVGAARTRELFLVGRRVDAHTAEAWGLVNFVVSPDRLAQDALGLAEEIAANAPIAQRGNKQVIRAVIGVEAALDEDTEAALIELRRTSLSSEDFREAVRAFAAKRRPVWRDR